MDEIFRLHCMHAGRKSKQVKDVLDGFYIDPPPPPWLGSLNFNITPPNQSVSVVVFIYHVGFFTRQCLRK